MKLKHVGNSAVRLLGFGRWCASLAIWVALWLGGYGRQQKAPPVEKNGARLRNARQAVTLRAMAQYNKPRINAAAKSSGLRRRLDTRRIDLDAPPRHLAVAAVGGVHAGITPGCISPSCTGPVAGIR